MRVCIYMPPCLSRSLSTVLSHSLSFLFLLFSHILSRTHHFSHALSHTFSLTLSLTIFELSTSTKLKSNILGLEVDTVTSRHLFLLVPACFTIIKSVLEEYVYLGTMLYSDNAPYSKRLTAAFLYKFIMMHMC